MRRTCVFHHCWIHGQGCGVGLADEAGEGGGGGVTIVVADHGCGRGEDTGERGLRWGFGIGHLLFFCVL